MSGIADIVQQPVKTAACHLQVQIYLTKATMSGIADIVQQPVKTAACHLQVQITKAT